MMFEGIRNSELRILFSACAALAMRANITQRFWTQEQRDTLRKLMEETEAILMRLVPESEDDMVQQEVKDSQALYDLQLAMLIEMKTRIEGPTKH